jgi:hypothetical protein
VFADFHELPLLPLTQKMGIYPGRSRNTTKQRF